MPYEICWLVEKRVILTTLTGIVTAEETTAVIQEIPLKIREGIPLVHHISHSLGIVKLEFSLKMLQTIVKDLKRPAEFGWQIEVTNNAINRMMSVLSNQWAGTRNRVVPTLEDAIEFLKMNDPTLAHENWLIPG